MSPTLSPAPAGNAAEPGNAAESGNAAKTSDAAKEVARIRRIGRARETAVSLVLLAAVLAAFGLALSYGEMVVPLSSVVSALAGSQADPGSHFIVVELRLPRALIGLLIGAAFGLAGALFQTLLRNPLASPDLIGISAGASAGAVVTSVSFGISGFALSASALAGSLVTAASIYLLAWRRGVTGYRLILIGIGVGGGLSSVVSYVLTNAEVADAQGALVWLTGSLNGSALEQVWPLAGSLAVLFPLTFLCSRTLAVLQLGDEAAAALGTRVERNRLILLLCAVGLTGVATAAAGPVAFVAFVAAPVARRLVPGRGAVLLPSALTGALLVLLADFAAQHLLWAQMPVGVVTSLIGAPYLLWLLATTNRVGRGG